MSWEINPFCVCGGQEDVWGVDMRGNGGNIFLLATSMVRPFKQEGGHFLNKKSKTRRFPRKLDLYT